MKINMFFKYKTDKEHIIAGRWLKNGVEITNYAVSQGKINEYSLPMDSTCVNIVSLWILYGFYGFYGFSL